MTARRTVSGLALLCAVIVLCLVTWRIAARRDRGGLAWATMGVATAAALLPQGLAELGWSAAPRGWIELIPALTALAGGVALGRRKRVGRDEHGSIDVLVAGLGTLLVLWELASGVPGAEPHGPLHPSNGVAFALPLAWMGVALCMARLSFATDRPVRGSASLIGGWALIALAELTPELALPASSPFAGPVPVALLSIGALVVASGLAGGELTALSEPSARPPSSVGWRRLGLLAAAQAGAGLVVLAQLELGREVDVVALVVGHVAIGLLVLVRVVNLVGAVERARRATRERDRWYRQLVRHSADVLFVLDRDNRLVFASPAITSLLDLEPGEVLGRRLSELVDAEDVARLDDRLDRLQQAREDSGRDDVVVRVMRPGGPPRWVELSLTDRRRDPTVKGVVINARDITTKKLAEDEISLAYDQQAAIAALGRQALGGADVNELASVAVAQVRRTLKIDSCELYKVPSGETSLLLEAADGPFRARVGELVLEAGATSQPGFAIGSRSEVVLSSDLATERRFPGSVHVDAGMRSAMSVVVRGGRAAYGVMTAAAERSG
ncbi:MAG: PAS domain S-box protein, partial [Acidimicrobiia bacterium]|nr:PAS domain S-box protein [Acidimicrobiia bacterium]